MQTKLKGLWEKVKGFFQKLSKKTLILLGVCAAVVLTVIIAAVILLNKKEYALLYTGLNTAETSTVVQYLSDHGVSDYRIQGDSILVPKGRENQILADLAVGGYLTTGFNYDYYTEHVSSFSTNAERVEATRIATVQKLEAVIRLMEGVRSAYVEINPGTNRIYVLDDNVTAGSAWVWVETEGNQLLSDGVVQGIRNMVSHSDKSLNIESVTIQDKRGNIYNDSSTIDKTGEASAQKMQFEQEINNQVRMQILQTLGAIYGEDNVRVGVSCSVDMDRKIVESTEYHQPEGSFNGRGLIGTEKWFEERIVGEDGTVGGVVGAGPNSDIPNYPDRELDVNGNETYAGHSGEIDTKIDTTVTQREVLAGTVSDVRVTVAVNQDARNGTFLSVQQLRDHVATAAGLGASTEEELATRVNVLIAPFDRVDPTPAREGILAFLADLPDWAVFAAIGGLVLFLILLIIILLLRRRSRKKKLAKQAALEAEMREAEEAAAAAAAAEILATAPTGGADIMEVNTEKSMELRKNVRQFAQNNPEIAAQMVKAWLKGEDVGG